MTRVLPMLLAVSPLLFATPASARAPRDGTLIVTVADPSGGIIPKATVTVTGADDATTAVALNPVMTSAKGIATITGLAPGRYTIQATFSGFDTGVLRDVRVRPGTNARTVILPLQHVEDSVTVVQDAQAAAADPHGNAFRTILTREEIGALSDDPTEMAQQLLDIAGGNAVIRVDGFNSGALPPKAMIASIRVNRDRFAAEHHSPDFDEIEIVTKPGVGPIRGGLSSRVRDGSMSGRSPFTPTKGPERTESYQGNVGGTLLRDKASFSLSAGSTKSFDTPTLNVALPGGGTRAEVANLRRPNDSWTTYDLFDYALTKNQALRVAYVQNNRIRENLGVGAYDLPERGYASNSDDRALRIQETGPLGPYLFAKTRLALHWSDTSTHAAVEAPTIRVLDAMTSGGAQVAGGRRVRDVEFASDVDYAHGIHALRAGVLLEGGTVRSDETSNYLGTYTFTSLAALAAGQPASYTRRIGDPLVQYGNLTAGAYIQDDLRVGKSLTFSPGVRYEVQSHVRDLQNVGPRLAVTWAPFKSGRTTLRASGGIFYEWLAASTYEQTLRVDGFGQQEVNIVNPAYPVAAIDTSVGGAAAAAAGASASAPATNRYVLSTDTRLGTTTRLDVGIDQTITPRLRIDASYFREHDGHVPRGLNLNAPIDGVRPDPASANVVEVVPDASFRGRQFQTNVTMNLAPPGRSANQGTFHWRREVVRASYTDSKQESNSDGPFSVPPSGTLATEWGPTFFNRRHRVSASIQSQAIRNLAATLSLAANTGTPYTITTGIDNNGDSIFNDRPAGIGRNSVRMPGQFTLSANISYSIALGTRPHAQDDRAKTDQGPRERYRLSWTVNVMNLTNHANDTGVSGVMTSPFFGQATAVLNPRKIDIGMRVGF
jgi:hypothetical protein